MSELERALSAIGGELDYPPTPALTPAVRARVVAAPSPRRGLRPREAIALAFAVLLIGAGSAFAASPRLRHSVLDWLGLRSVEIVRVPRLPATAAGDQLALGTRTTLQGAARAASFTPVVPAGEPPDEVYFSEEPPGGQVGLVYTRPGGVRMLITEFRGQQQSVFIQKTLGPGTTAEAVSVSGQPGIWIAGMPHVLMYKDRSGQVQGYTPRLATNTLLWRQGDLLLRLEAHISKAAALKIAGSMR